MTTEARDMLAAEIIARAELKPCPFCGGEASDAGHVRYSKPLTDTWWDDGSPITEAFYVNCIKCGIDNGRAGLVGGYRTRAEANERWNTRAQLPDQFGLPTIGGGE
jgi:hypothetical protein